MTDDDCSHVISALVLNPSHLRELNLNRNKPGESGLRDLCDFLKNPKCTLQTLKLSDCNITEEGYTALIKALKSNRSSLIELDLRGNDPGPSGLKELRNLMNDKKCKLKTLRVLKSPDAQKASDHLTEVLGINPILQTDLNLSGKIDGDSGVEQLSVLLKDPHCRPETLQLSECNVTEKGCSALLTALRSEHSTLKELNLSKNRIQDSGVKLLSEELKNKLCKLDTLRLMDNNIREEGYSALSEALKSSHLIELDLRGNDPGASGVKLLTDLLQDPDCKLNTLRLLKSPAAQEGCDLLYRVLGVNPLLQRELNVSEKISGDSQVKQLSALLEDSHCRPEILKVNNSRMTNEGCAALTSALGLNPSHLRELELSGNKLGGSGMKELCGVLKNQQFNLLKLGDRGGTRPEGPPGCRGPQGLPLHQGLTESEPQAQPVAQKPTGATPAPEKPRTAEPAAAKPRSARSDRKKSRGLLRKALVGSGAVLEPPALTDTGKEVQGNRMGETPVQGDGGDVLSSAKVNWAKSEAILVGEWGGERPTLPGGLVWKKDGFKYLGVYLGNNEFLNKNWEGTVEHVKGKLSRWKRLVPRMSYRERTLVINNLAALYLWHKLACVDPPPNLLASIQALLVDYFLDGLHWIPQSVLHLTKEERGQWLIQLASRTAAFCLQFLQRLLTGPKDLIWRAVAHGLLHKVRGLGLDRTLFLMDTKMLDVSGLPSFYRGLFKFWNCFRKRNKGCGTLHWLLEEPLIHGGRLDISGVTAHALFRALISSRVVTLQELVNIAGTDLSLAEDLAARLGLRLCSCSLTEDDCTAVVSALGTNPSHLKELDLSDNTIGDTGVKQLSDLLKDPQCRTEKLRLNKSSITHRGCTDLISALTSNPSHLTELDLSENTLGNSAMDKISTLLQNSSCKLQKLVLSDCSVTGEGYTALVKALNSNPSSPLMELDLRGNDPGTSGMKEIRNLMNDPKCKLKTPKKSTTDAIFALRILMEKYRDGQRELHCVFVDLEKAYDRVPREELWYCMRKSGVAEKYVRVVQDMYERSRTVVRCAIGQTEEFKVEVGLHQGSALSPFLFAIVMDQLSEEVRQESPWTMKFADDIVICSESREQVEENLERWRFALERRGMKVSRIQSNGECGKEVSAGRVLKSPDAQKASDHLTEVLGINPILQTDLNLSGKIDGDSGVEQLSVLLKDPHCRPETLQLSECNVTEKGCSALLTALRSEHSTLKELNLSKNRIQDSGVKLLSEELKNKLCKLETLRLSDCSITEEGYTALSEALKSSHLIELDLRGNDPGASGVKLLTDLLQDPDCKLKTLRLLKSPDAEKAYTKMFSKNPLLHTELDLSNKTPKDVKVKQLSALLQDPHYRLQKLTLYKGDSMTDDDCSHVISALVLNPSHLRELNLNRNKPGESGLRDLCDFLKNPKCTLQTLKLSDCNITEEGYTALIKALKSNRSSLIELDLRGNDPGPSGLKELRNLMNDKKCKLKTLRVLKSPDAQKASDHLTEVLGINPILQTDLNLSEKIDGDSGVEQLSVLLKDLLKDPHCRPETLNNYNYAAKYSIYLLRLSDCSITEEGYSALAEALKSSHLIELDLRGNDPGASGVKLLTDLLQDPDCKLKTVKLLKSPDAVKACEYLTEVLVELLKIVVDLFLLRLTECGVTMESCRTLAEVLSSYPCFLTEFLDSTPPGAMISYRGPVSMASVCALSLYWSGGSVLVVSHCAQWAEGQDQPGQETLLSAQLLALQGFVVTALRSTVLLPRGEQKVYLPKEFLVSFHLQCTDPGFGELQQVLSIFIDLLYKEDSMTDDDCSHVISALVLNPSHLRELNLNRNKPGESGLRDLCDFLKNPKCTLQTLKLWRSVKGKSCTDLFSALCTNPSHIRELDLSGCELGDSGVEKLCDLLKKHECKLEKLLLRASVREKSCTALVSALCTNPSHIRELDLSGCELGDSGVEKLCDLLKKHECKLEKLLLWKSVKGKSCTDLFSALCTNPSHIRELDLSWCELGDSGVEKLCDLLKKHECKLEKLLLMYCSITDRGCAALTAALEVNSSHLKEMDLRGNKLGNSVRHLEEILKRSGGKLIYFQSTR
ncbi:hypothetical protein QTP86_015308 [Hemibagrus guttatus]|nr:hypothetical protein QTP86_015308 [Hemibagrus guttatus]